MPRSPIPIQVIAPLGDVVEGATVSLKNRVDSTAATHYSAETAGTSSTADITTDSVGETGRWLVPGRYLYDLAPPSPNPLGLGSRTDVPLDIPIAGVEDSATIAHSLSGVNLSSSIVAGSITGSHINISTTSQFARGGFGVAAGGNARITFPAEVGLAAGIDFGGDLSLTREAAAHLRVSRIGTGNAILDVNSSSGQDTFLRLQQAASTQWQFVVNGSNQKLRISDGAKDYIRFDPATDTVEFPFRAADNGASSVGHLTFQLGAVAWDVSASPNGVFTGYVTVCSNGFVGGVNDRGGGVTDDVTGSDAPNDPTSASLSWWRPWNDSFTFASKGILTGRYAGLIQRKPTGATFPNTYNEARIYDNHLIIDNKGANCSVIETGTKVYSATAPSGFSGDGGPARARGLVCSVTEYNSYASYDSATIFGTSLFRNTGAMPVMIQAGGPYLVGTGIKMGGGGGASDSAWDSAYKRAFVLINRAGTLDLFCVDGKGNIGVRKSTNQAGNLAAALTLGYDNTGAESTLAADGLLYGDDTNLYRSAADTLKTDDNFTCGLVLRANQQFILESSAALGFIQQNSQSSAVVAPSTSGAARTYIRNGKFVVAYNNGGTPAYFTIDLTATAAQQVAYSASAP